MASPGLWYTKRQLDYAKLQIDRIDRSVKVQTFSQLLERAERIPLTEGSDCIRLIDIQNYEDFKKLPPEQQPKVRITVDFFNGIGHLIAEGVVNGDRVLELWGISVLSCSDRLLPGWLDGYREERAYGFNDQQCKELLYRTFEGLCYQVRQRVSAAGIKPPKAAT